MSKANQKHFDFGTRKAGFVRGSMTSEEAAKSIEPRLGELQKLVLALFINVGTKGLTDEELLAALKERGIGANTGRPRRVELVRLGLLADCGMRRENNSKRKATVWCRTNAMHFGEFYTRIWKEAFLPADIVAQERAKEIMEGG